MKPAFIIVDMLKDFVTGSLRTERAERIVPAIKEFMDFSRKKGIPIVFAVDSHLENIDKELKLWGPHAIRGTEGEEIIEELQPSNKDYIVRKRRYSAFFETDLDLLLRELEVDTLIFSGIHAHICVQHTVADAFYRGYSLFVLSDCVEASTPKDKEEGLRYMKEFYGAKVVTSKEFIDEFGEKIER